MWEAGAEIFGAGVAGGLASIEIEILDFGGWGLKFAKEAKLDIGEELECILIFGAAVFGAESDVQFAAEDAAGGEGGAGEIGFERRLRGVAGHHGILDGKRVGGKGGEGESAPLAMITMRV
jgi:hypothetical protein